ncbi:hypothetical protein [Rhodovibrio salinarum]|uniref:Uncharacterized protein n=1 Tax=Rhodovibrio salinarum TaxID=1087 RepID=A0A934QL39_9PROT|nr:hypothetical protein [Rhodovibrio salinarum]MBK1698514.1 hypothetical protein [Rhodovibrio salinarum]
MIGDCGFGRSIVRGLRAAWQRDTARRQEVQERLLENPGRAEGRVADWSVDRIVEYLRRDSRRTMRFADVESCELTGDERHLMSLLEDMRDQQAQQAEMKAQWLVKPAKIAGLLERMRPLADIANRHDMTDAELHRQSARAIMDAYQHGAV